MMISTPLPIRPPKLLQSIQIVERRMVVAIERKINHDLPDLSIRPQSGIFRLPDVSETDLRLTRRGPPRHAMRNLEGVLVLDVQFFEEKLADLM